MTSLGDGENGNDVKTNFIEELYDKFLECRLCSRTYRHPKMLVCQHTFCADCLEAHYEMDEQDRPYRFLLSHNRDLLCPCCRARTPLPTGGVWRLPDNFLVAKLTDIIQRRGPAVAAKSGGGGCEICRPVSVAWNDDRSGSGEDSKEQAATVKCIDCDKLLCADCAELHRETKVTASHALFTIGDDRDVACKIHRNETLRFYCEPCEQCVCVLCALHEHNEHEVSSLAAGLERHRGTFDALLDDCKRCINAVREQLTLADAFKSSLNAAEDHIRHAAIDAIAAVRQRERELLDGLRSFVGDDAMRFLEERDSLGVRLAELDDIRETTEAMVGGSSVELLMTKKEVHERIRTALDRQQMQTPDKVRLGGVRFDVDAKPFHNLHRPKPGISNLFRSVADNGDHANEGGVIDRSSPSSSSSSSDSETDSDTDSEDTHRRLETIRVTSDLPHVEHVDLVAQSQDESESTEDSDDSDESDKKDTSAPITKICISDGVVRRMVIHSQSLCENSAPPSPPPRPSGRKIPDFSRPKPVVKYADHATQMEQVETTDAATTTARVVVCDKETYTGFVYMVHKNVTTDNLGTADKGTSMATDVTAAYRNVSNNGRSVTFTRGTNTLKGMTSDRASSPIAALRSPTALINSPAAAATGPAYPTNQKPGSVQAPLTTQKLSTPCAVSVTSSQISPIASKVPAEAQKAPGTPGAANMALSVTSSTASVQPVSTPSSTVITSQKQTTPVVPISAQDRPTSSKLPPISQKLMTSSSAISTSLLPVAATAPSQSVTSPSQAMTSSVVVSTQPQQKPPSASTSSDTLATASGSTTRISSPTVAVAGASRTSTVASNAVQKPVTSSNGVLFTDSPTSPTQISAQSVNDSKLQTLSSKPSTPTSLVMPANKQVTSPPISSTTAPVAAAVTVSHLPPPTQKLLTPEQHCQSSPSRSLTAAVPSQSALNTAPVSPSQIMSPVTQISNATQPRTTSSALASNVIQKTLAPVSQTTHTPTDNMSTTPSAQKLMSSLSQLQPMSNTSPVNVTSSTSVQSQTHTSSSIISVPSTVTNSIRVSPTAQKSMTSSTSPVVDTAVTTGVTTTSQTAIRNNVAVTSMPLNLTTPTTLSPAQMSTQKPVTSPASFTTRSQRPTLVTTTAQIVTSQATTFNNHVSNTTTTSVPLAPTSTQKSMTTTPSSISVSTNVQKLTTSGNGRQQEAMTSSPSAAVENLDAAGVTSASLAPTAQTSRMTASNSSRPRSVFRSMSMDNVRTPAPVLRLPPPIMTTSVAAVTQRLNGGALNGSNKNNWRPNS